MNKLVLVFTMIFFTESYAEVDCLQSTRAPIEEIDIKANLGNEISCHLNFPKNKRYDPASCDQYKICVKSQDLSSVHFDAKKLAAQKKIAILHGRQLLKRDKRRISDFASYTDLRQYLADNIKGEAPPCESPLKITNPDTEKCDRSLLDEVLSDPQLSEDKKIFELYSSENPPIDNFAKLYRPLFDFKTEEFGDDIEKAFKAFSETQDYKNIKARIKKSAVAKNTDKENFISKLIKGDNFKNRVKEILREKSPEKRESVFNNMLKSHGFEAAKILCNDFKINNLQNYCEEITRLNRGKSQDSIFYPHPLAISEFYENEQPAPDVFMNKFRCELFNIDSKLGSFFSSVVGRGTEEEYNRWKTNEQKTIQNLDGLVSSVGKSFSGVDFSSSQNRGDFVAAPDSGKVYGSDNIGSKEFGASDSQSTTQSVVEVAANIANKLEEHNGQGQAVVPGSSFLPSSSAYNGSVGQNSNSVMSSIPSRDAAVGVNDVLSNPSTSKEATDDNKSNKEELAVELSAAREKLDALQKQVSENQKEESEKEIEALKQKLKEVQNAKSSEASLNAPKIAAPSIQSNTNLQQNMPAQQVDAQAESVVRANENGGVSEMGRAPASAIPVGKQVTNAGTSNNANSNSAASTNSGGGVFFTVVELPKYVDYRSEEALQEFIDKTAKELDGKTFKFFHPIRGEMVVTPKKDEKGNYLSVPLPIEHLKKLANKNKVARTGKKKIELIVEPVRAPASDIGPARVNIYKDLAEKTKEALKK